MWFDFDRKRGEWEHFGVKKRGKFLRKAKKPSREVLSHQKKIKGKNGIQVLGWICTTMKLQ